MGEQSAITWERAVAVEPRLAVLLDRARRLHAAKKCTENEPHWHLWYGCGDRPACECRGGLKQEVVDLVGWNASAPELTNCAAYDLGYHTVYDALFGLAPVPRPQEPPASNPRAVSSRLRFRILERDGFRCRYCGKSAAAAQLHVDHVKPLAAGGLDEESNLVTACSDCNLGKGARVLALPMST